MKKYVYILLILSIVSCGNNYSNFEGKWVGKNYENDMIVISRNDNNFIVKINQKKFPANVNDELLEISATIPLKAIIDNNDELIISGNTYIRFEKSQKPKFIGVWKQKLDEDIQNRDFCSYLFYDLNIRIDDQTNRLIIEGGNSFDETFTTDKDINFQYKPIKYGKGNLYGRYKYYCNPGIDAPPVEVNGNYYEHYTFYKNYQIKLIDENKLELIFINNKKNCPSIYYYKQ